MTTSIIFNGPPLSGKDCAAGYCVSEFGGQQLQMKDKLIELTKCVFDITDEKFDWYYQRENKERKFSELGDRSIREALICVSEEMVKPVLGKGYFGRAAANKLIDDLNFFSDGGFVEELLPVVDRSDKTYIIQIKRDGHTFDNDSRDYVEHPDAELVVIENNGSLDEFINTIDRKVGQLDLFN